MNDRTAAGRKRMRVVIADDTPAMLRAVEQQLASEYIIVGNASDGVGLIDCARELKPDVLVTDISMPNLNGIEALRQLRDLGIQIPAVILTVCEDEEVLNEALFLGVQGFVLKSRLASDLRPAIREVLAGRPFVSERLRKGRGPK